MMPANNVHVSDKSIASLSGLSQSLLAANGNRVTLIIQNIGSASIGVNLSGGTAAIGATGTITLASGSAPLVLDLNVPNNAVSVIGTAGQPVLCLEG